MNQKRNILVKIFILGLTINTIGFLGLKSAVARSQLFFEKEQLLSQNTFNLNGNWNVNWLYKGVYHRGKLFVNGSRGTLLITVQRSNGQIIELQQNMTVIQTGRNSFRLEGSTPTYPGTTTPYPGAFRDIIYVKRNGIQISATICGGGECHETSMFRI